MDNAISFTLSFEDFLDRVAYSAMEATKVAIFPPIDKLLLQMYVSKYLILTLIQDWHNGCAGTLHSEEKKRISTEWSSFVLDFP